MPSEVIIRLGSHAEKEYLLKTLNLFSGTIIGANLLETTPGATVSLAWKIRSENKALFIDPMSYLFGIDLDYISSDSTNVLKKSFESMCKQLGEPFTSIILKKKRSLRPSDFETDEDILAICHCVMKYQLHRMEAICKGDAQLREVANQTSPSAVLSPYFYLPSDSVKLADEWEDVAIRIIEAFGTVKSPVPKHAVLCIARRLLKERTGLERILGRVMDSGCDACWLWISALREEDITETEIKNLVSLLKRAKLRNFPLWNMHGGFLSALLSKHGLAGFSHSIGYGESKDVLPISGGAVPTVAYHYNPLHVRCSVPDIERAFSSIGVIDAKSFHETVCDCVMCKGTLKGDLRNFRKFGELVLKPGNIRQSQTAESAKRCRFHFLLARKIELDFVNGDSLEALLAYLRAIVDEYQSLGHSIRLRDRASALDVWTSHL
jgi:hypothetical protein